MTKNQFYTFLFFILPLIYFFSLPIETGDLAIWTAEGKRILSSGSIHSFDSFSFLKTTDLFYPLLTSVVYGIIDHLFNLVGVSVFHKLVFVVLLFQLYQVFKEMNLENTTILFLIYFSVIWGLSFIMIDRPALLALPFFVFSFRYLSKVEKLTRKDFFIFFLLSVLWLNTHGSWSILLVLVLIKFVANYFENKKLDWSLVLLFFLILITTLLNPNGFKFFELSFLTAKVSKLRNLNEWSLSWGMEKYFSQTISFYIIIFFALMSEVKKLKKRDFFVDISFLFFTLFGVLAVRNTIWLFLILPIWLMQFNFGKIKDHSSEKSVVNLGISLLLLFLLMVFFPTSKDFFKNWLPESKKHVFSPKTPIKISEYLKNAKMHGNIFNQWELGSYLAYAQTNKIYMDARNIIFSETDFGNYINIAFNQTSNLNNLLEEYQIQYIVISKKDLNSLYQELLQDSKNWELIMTEYELVLFEKRA